MHKYVSPTLFSANPTTNDKNTSEAYRLISAKEMKVQEDWLQAAIKHNPDLVIAPCRSAGLTNERWWSWGREVESGVGPIDVLLVSESGRVGIVETKLHYNPEARRTVVAQLLDYAAHLPLKPFANLPSLPSQAKLRNDEVEQRIQQGDFLLIIAGDQVDDRAVRLTKTFLGSHIVNEWDLALVEVAAYKSVDNREPLHILVPHLRGVLEKEIRQIVRVEAGKVVLVQAPVSSPHDWGVERFLAALAPSPLSPLSKAFARGLCHLAETFSASPRVSVGFGSGKLGQIIIRRKNQGFIYLSLDGLVSFYGDRLPLALGESVAKDFLDGIRVLFPGKITSPLPPNRWTTLKCNEIEAQLPAYLEIVTQALSQADQSDPENPPHG